MRESDCNDCAFTEKVVNQIINERRHKEIIMNLTGDTLFYKIWDRETLTYWTTDGKKGIWTSIGGAKNAWRLSTQSWSRVKEPISFNDQDRYVIHSFELTYIEEIDHGKNDI